MASTRSRQPFSYRAAYPNCRRISSTDGQRVVIVLDHISLNLGRYAKTPPSQAIPRFIQLNQ